MCAVIEIYGTGENVLCVLPKIPCVILYLIQCHYKYAYDLNVPVKAM